ncbi:hypothetical protein E2L08_01905 [Palleronia sediminis]|uniref:DUF5337 domain-containing protein n=1 Tax=Palleronia sediminis TaxID=2547833 RepID=A0A4R6ALU6_9RHOB|nr:DUF5337 domain-containing protein [Palleronia sediminis]TDL84244.1 hypothetical protein E2L08_01905 [Palleronia sediminis]
MSRDDRQLARARRARNVGVVMAITMIAWFGAQLVGGALGLPPRAVFVVDLAALAAFVWALVATFRIWQSGREDDR